VAISVSKPDRRNLSAPLDTQYSQQEVADILGVGHSTVRKWVAEGKLRAYRFGPRLIRIDAADLRKFREQIAPTTFEHVNGGGVL